jgi:hypothetical protein
VGFLTIHYRRGCRSGLIMLCAYLWWVVRAVEGEGEGSLGRPGVILLFYVRSVI